MAMQQHAGVKRNAFQMNVNQENMCEPQLEIEEEPKCTGYRFRYECEGGAHGNINGANSTKSKKTFPTVKLKNWKGAATISVQCITNEDKYQRHTHDLLGKECSNGVCVMELKANNQDHTAVFSGLSIKHCTRKLAKQIMTSRNEESILAKKMQNTLVTHGESAADHKFVLTDEEKKRAQDEAVATCNNLELSVVRLLFQANLIVNGNVVQKLEAISCPIYDAKAPGAAALRICRMDKSSGSCVGNEEVFLLCDKVQKDDISVSFQEYAPDGSIMWEAYAKFGPQDVHRQLFLHCTQL